MTFVNLDVKIKVKKRGAPRGNRNALKHGFYSHLYRRGEIHLLALPSRTQLQDEIDLFKVLIDRIARRINTSDQGALSFDEYVFALHTLSMAISRLNSFQHAHRWLFPDSDEDIARWSRMLGISDQEFRTCLQSLDTEDSESQSGKHFGGGQPGTTNALQHGFYSSVFHLDEIRRLERLKGIHVEDEKQLLRILIKRTVASMDAKGYSKLTFMEQVRALRAVTFAGACLERLERAAFLGKPAESFIGRLLHEVLKKVNPPQEAA